MEINMCFIGITFLVILFLLGFAGVGLGLWLFIDNFIHPNYDDGCPKD